MTPPESVAEQYKKLEKAASPGPWRWNESHAVFDDDDTWILEADGAHYEADAQLAVLGRNHMLPLLAALEFVRNKQRHFTTYNLAANRAIDEALDAIARDLTAMSQSAKEVPG